MEIFLSRGGRKGTELVVRDKLPYICNVYVITGYGDVEQCYHSHQHLQENGLLLHTCEYAFAIVSPQFFCGVRKIAKAISLNLKQNLKKLNVILHEKEEGTKCSIYQTCLI